MWFQPVGLFENAMAASCQGVVDQLIRSPESFRCGLFFSQMMPFPMRAFAAHSLLTTQLTGEFCLLGGELALPHPGVARVSRLIGNFDTTGKAHLWQVGVLCRIIFGNDCVK